MNRKYGNILADGRRQQRYYKEDGMQSAVQVPVWEKVNFSQHIKIRKLKFPKGETVI